MTDGLEAMRAQLRTDRPTPARMYDYYLGGKDNFEVDRMAVEAMGPKITDLLRNAAWENRRFLWRAVEYLSGECGITQFIDIGSGLPTVRSTHEVAQDANPGVRVVYVDNDPIVLSHGQALLAKNGNTAVVNADVRDPAGILQAPETQALIDLTKPVAILIVALLHFVTTPDHPRHRAGDLAPAELLAVFRERVVPGSYLVVTHGTFEGVTPDERALIEGLYQGSTTPGVFRSHEEITELFAGWRPLEPGIVEPWQWPVEDPLSPRSTILYGGVAIKEDDTAQ